MSWYIPTGKNSIDWTNRGAEYVGTMCGLVIADNGYSNEDEVNNTMRTML
jgi:hypothetical protein